ncbi:MAG: hypothetical protein HY902_21320 [Deltaproteobacteria bacterium]|nr:hypothetical protein [Deltaproteobacteria bacterium]
MHTPFSVVGRWAPLLLAAALAAGCGPGVQLERAAGVPRFAALPIKSEIKVVESADVLAQPVTVVGTLRTDTAKGEADRPQVVVALSNQARRVGCDALVGLSRRDEVTTSQKTVERLGAGGAKVRSQEAVEKHTYKWQAQCVRSALMDPGAKPAPHSEPSPPPAAPDPAPAVEPEPSTPDGKTAKDVADLLLERKVFVRAMVDKLQKPAPDPADVVDALVETMVQVTGPTGLWRKTMPQEWFGCLAAADTPACLRLRDLDRDLRHADALHTEASGLSRGQSGGWLRRSEARVVEYLRTYVPLEASLAGVQATPFYREKLADVAQ